MKKKIYVLIILLIFIIAVALLSIYYKNSEQNSNEQNVATVKNIEKEQNYKFKAFQPSYSTSYDGSDSFDLTRDFIYEDGIYYKKINTYEEYKIAKDRWYDILDMQENDFADNFMVLTVIENSSMIGLTVDSIKSNDYALQINLKRYEKYKSYNPSETGISYIISRDLERENIVVTHNS